MTTTPSATGRALCATEENQPLFSSRHLAPFEDALYKEEHPNPTHQEIEEAKKEHLKEYLKATHKAALICTQCPLKKTCLENALSSAEPIYGVTAAITETERYLIAPNTATAIPRIERTIQYKQLKTEIEHMNMAGIPIIAHTQKTST